MNEKPIIVLIALSVLTMVALSSTNASAPAPLVTFPAATPVASTVMVSEIIRDRQIQRVEVLLDRAVFFGPVSLHTEMAKILSLLASPRVVSEAPTSLLALEDHGPTIRVIMSSNDEVIIRRIHNNCYRFYWEGKTTWFQYDKSSK